MTVKQATHCMKFNCELAVCEECDLYGTVGTDHCFEDACREAIKALEKQIPKKVKQSIVDGKMARRCPNNCEITYITQYASINYCPYCGQAIKWE